MIAIDTSAIIAILQREPEKAQFIDIIKRTDTCIISMPTALELHLVSANRRNNIPINAPEMLLAKFEVKTIPFNIEQLTIAKEAYTNFGKGRHPASLNFGDCFSYALAKSRGVPLLYKGDDFRRTDVVAAYKN